MKVKTNKHKHFKTYEIVQTNFTNVQYNKHFKHEHDKIHDKKHKHKYNKHIKHKDKHYFVEEEIPVRGL